LSLWPALAGMAAGLILVWVILVVGLYVIARKEDDQTSLRDLLRLVPDVVQLMRRLAADPTLPRGVRWRLGLLLAYLMSPIDLIPDFIPVIGYADDAAIVAVALRSVVRAAGAEAIERHWPGTQQGLSVIRRVGGMQPRRA
jgi:uncharacterized membrane protein YkvA (DUF1232 family)